MQNNKEVTTNGVTTIKMEPGTSKRLPSLKPPRDLSLASFTPKMLPTNLSQTSGRKKVYMPRLNVQRNRTQESMTSIKQESKDVKPTINTAERGRGRGKKNFVQSSSIFAEGVAQNMKNGRFSSRYSTGEDSEKPTLQKPILLKQEDMKINKEEEDSILNELLRDDFIDDPTLEPDYTCCPVLLPLDNTKILEDSKEEKEKPEIKIKTEPISPIKNVNSFGNVKIKIEPGLEQEAEVSPEVDLKISSKIKKETKSPLSIREIIDSNEQQLVMLQLPNCIPGFHLIKDKEPKATTSTSTTNSSNSSNNQESLENVYSIKTMKPGLVGKMQQLQSGRVRMLLGDSVYYLEPGSYLKFKQELVSVDLDPNTKTGRTISLGALPTRIIVSPDWEQLLSSKAMDND